MERARALSETCDQQMRPVLMTCVAACVGLIPAAFSTAIGSQVQRPLAVVVVGGTLLAPVLILTVLPAALSIFSRGGPRCRRREVERRLGARLQARHDLPDRAASPAALMIMRRRRARSGSLSGPGGTRCEAQPLFGTSTMARPPEFMRPAQSAACAPPPKNTSPRAGPWIAAPASWAIISRR